MLIKKFPLTEGRKGMDLHDSMGAKFNKTISPE